ncbi:GntR family transcriptional regulator [Plantibacter sp. Mn2098]|uniref:GntR family transcriptional regulator n=1 Tax=Plantibacter sp. Mn2098 TaxID=3395266 RepID=UPI003BD2E5F0
MPTNTPTNLTRRLLRDEIYDTILNAVLDGTLEPGEQLHDEALTTWLGASRTPVREALNKLAEDGVVELVPHKYTRVAPLDFRAINEALFVSGVLHEYAARQVVGSLTEADRTALQTFADNAVDAHERNDLGALGPAIRDFFLAFERATPNRVLVETVESLSLQLLRFLTPREGLTAVEDMVSQITGINEAAQAGDAARTGDLIHALYEPTRQNFITTFRNQ